ncbi:MAG: hypothetical protein IT186_10655 [Acidobacteria bacterium]|nr:hypothetical protein [Acidobacteriota bacterium]MCG3191918.1 hypothetical protein [Thermoanaerobaculia bacterium]MCK6681818.1 hypothetical protein [Thermoanaerobaculia bacterium]
MKMLMLIVSDEKKEELEVLLGRAGVAGYTEIPGARGAGVTGPRMGSAAFPKTSAVLFTLVDDETLARVKESVRAYCQDCGERLKMAVWALEESF